MQQPLLLGSLIPSRPSMHLNQFSAFRAPQSVPQTRRRVSCPLPLVRSLPFDNNWSFEKAVSYITNLPLPFPMHTHLKLVKISCVLDLDKDSCSHCFLFPWLLRSLITELSCNTFIALFSPTTYYTPHRSTRPKEFYSWHCGSGTDPGDEAGVGNRKRVNSEAIFHCFCTLFLYFPISYKDQVFLSDGSEVGRTLKKCPNILHSLKHKFKYFRRTAKFSKIWLQPTCTAFT